MVRLTNADSLQFLAAVEDSIGHLNARKEQAIAAGDLGVEIACTMTIAELTRIRDGVLAQLNNGTDETLDKLAKIFNSPIRNFINGDALAKARALLLNPSELERLERGGNRITCAGCSEMIQPGEMLSYTARGDLLCTQCFIPETISCKGCHEKINVFAHVSSLLKRVSKGHCGPNIKKAEDAEITTGTQDPFANIRDAAARLRAENQRMATPQTLEEAAGLRPGARPLGRAATRVRWGEIQATPPVPEVLQTTDNTPTAGPWIQVTGGANDNVVPFNVDTLEQAAWDVRRRQAAEADEIIRQLQANPGGNNGGR